MTKVDRANHAVAVAQADLDSAVRAARNGGVTWAELGDVLGTTRQAAQMRFRLVGADTPLTRAFPGIPVPRTPGG